VKHLGAKGARQRLCAARGKRMPAQQHPPAFGYLLKRYRLAHGLTQERLAAQAGLSTRAISDLECAVNRKLHADTLALLVTAQRLAAADGEALSAATHCDIQAAYEVPRNARSWPAWNAPARSTSRCVLLIAPPA